MCVDYSVTRDRGLIRGRDIAGRAAPPNKRQKCRTGPAVSKSRDAPQWIPALVVG